MKDLIELRKELHAYPEVSGTEKDTAKRIFQFLKSCSPDQIITDLGGHGLLAVYDSKKPGKSILFRADIDALPIQEVNDFAHRSKYPGVSHKCGHDGHATILCGLAQWLDNHRPQEGKIHLLWQPAEENGEGAAAVLADSKFENIHPDLVFALHNLPGYKLGEVVLRSGSFTPSVTSLIIRYHGKTSHAAEPEHGINPGLALAELLQKSVALDNNYPDKEDFAVVTPVYMTLGSKAYGISAGSGELHLTLRCWTDDHLDNLKKSILNHSIQIATAHRLTYECEELQTFKATMNDEHATSIVKKSLGNLVQVERNYPFKWGEDYGLFTSKFPGCMFGIGAGEHHPALHNPDYDFPDEALAHGIQIFSSIVRQVYNV